MDLFEASKFYGDYRLALEILEHELSENSDNTDTHQEILSCSESSNDLQ